MLSVRLKDHGNCCFPGTDYMRICLEEVIENALRKVARRSEAADSFLAEDHSWPRFALGKNADTLAIHRVAPLNAIIDDYCTIGEHWNDIPLIRSMDATKDARVVNCSTSIRPVSSLDMLNGAGFRVVAGIHEVVESACGAVAWPRFVLAQRRELNDYLATWQHILDALGDPRSQRTLADLLQFRVTADPAYMRGYEVRTEHQYFEDFMEYGDEIFVDAGGFDGDTSESFAQRHPDYRKIMLFEPSEKNMAAARRRLAAFRNIEFFPIGLSDAKGRLRFDSESGSASAVATNGDAEILADTLDSVVADPVSFIKMDLEGWELPALRGSQRHIQQDVPKLAIAAYHSSSDLRLIHDYVSSFDHDYRVFVRHYTQGWSETVLYFRKAAST
jgi:FkbM family methyltransferase